MFAKTVLFISACAITVNSFVTYGDSAERYLKTNTKKMTRSSWSDNQSWDDQNWKEQENLEAAGMTNKYFSATQNKRHILDSSSDSEEKWQDSPENFEFQQVQKIYHNTNPEEAGNAREVSNQGESDRSLKSKFSNSDESATYNRINKDVNRL